LYADNATQKNVKQRVNSFVFSAFLLFENKKEKLRTVKRKTFPRSFPKKRIPVTNRYWVKLFIY
jgi:hypothetical protein